MSLSANHSPAFLILVLGVLPLIYFINAVITGVAWRRNRTPLHLNSFLYWCLIVASMPFGAFAPSLPPDWNVFLMFTAAPPFIFLARAQATLLGLEDRWKLDLGAITALTLLSAALSASPLETPWAWLASPCAVAFPTARTFVSVLLRRNQRPLTPLLIGLTAMSFLVAAHMLIYPFIGTSPDTAIYGYLITCPIMLTHTAIFQSATLEANLEDLRFREKFARASKYAEIGELAAGISHEINNPLTILVNRAQQALAKPESASVRYELERILAISMRIQGIMQGLKVLASNSPTNPGASASEVGWSQIQRELRELCGPACEPCGISLRFVPPTSSTKFICNPVQLTQILVNLVQNSVDALSVAGAKESWIELKIEEDENRARIHVTDSGSIPSGQSRERLFYPLYTTKPAGKGTGIGLSLSRRLAEANQGSLEFAENHPTTRFTLSLPAAVAPHPTISPPKTPSTSPVM